MHKTINLILAEERRRSYQASSTNFADEPTRCATRCVVFSLIVSITPQAIQRLFLLSGYDESNLNDDDGTHYSSSLRIAWVFRLYVCRLSPRPEGRSETMTARRRFFPSPIRAESNEDACHVLGA